MMKIDQRDKEILYALDFHARDSVTQIAKRLRISQDTLNYRIKRLEKLGIIKGYYIVPDTTKLGLVSYKVMLKYQNTTREVEQEIILYLVDAKEVGWAVKAEGYYDLMFMTWTKNEYFFDIFLSAFLDKFSAFLYLRDIVIITENHACSKSYLTSKKEKKKEEVFYRGEARNICDDIDEKIINILSRNARLSAIEIAQEVGLTAEGVSHRIKNLRKRGIITAFRPRIDLNKAGYLFYNVLFRLNKTSDITKFFSFARQHLNVTYFVRYVGIYDLGFDIEIQSPEEFRKLLSEIRKLFGSSLIYYNSVMIFDEVKITYI